MFVENCILEKIIVKDQKVSGVETNKGRINCTYLVNCGGLWARNIGLLSDPRVKVPVYAVANHVLITKLKEPSPSGIPIIRDMDGKIYFRESLGKIIAGGYEEEAKPISDRLLPRKNIAIY